MPVVAKPELRIGLKFNRLTIISVSRTFRLNRHFYTHYLCKCDCGKEIVCEYGNVKSGRTKSCGCKREGMNSTHKMSKTRIYHIWAGMRRRCAKKDQKWYERYAGRGIKVCDEWSDFNVFRDWSLTNGYSDKLTIDRMDNDGNYEPGNCRWVTVKEQANNTSTNVYVEHNGERLTYAQWSLRLCKNPSLVSKRINEMGWDPIKAITIPKFNRGR